MKKTGQNPLQVPTWGWLGINEANLAVQAGGGYEKEPKLSGTEGITLYNGLRTEDFSGLPPEVERARAHGAEHHNLALTIEIPQGLRLAEPIVIEFDLDEHDPFLYDYIAIRAGKNSRAAVVIAYRSGGNAPCRHRGFTHLEAAEGAEIKLLKSQLLGRDSTHTDMTAARLQRGARADLLLCEVGGSDCVAGCSVVLQGDDSSARLDCMYLGRDEKKQDLSYRMEYRGRNSEGHITVKGALAGKSRKVLKSTLDFLPGAAGAKGREEESVLVLDKGVVNISAPLLLCGEDNVEGEHATTTGRPGGDKLFYLMSRGLSRRQAIKLLVRAALAPVLEQVEQETLRQEMLLRMEEVIDSEE